MTYRDENEALRARVEKLEEENRELHEKLEPKVNAPEPTPIRSGPGPGRGVVRTTAWILGGALVLGACVYVCSSDFKASRWDGKTPFVCPNNANYGDEYTLRDKVIRVPDGTAVTAQRGCKITLVRCDIRAKSGIRVNDGSVVLEDSHVEATEVGLAVGSSDGAVVRRSTIAAPRAIEVGKSSRGVLLEQSRIDGTDVALRLVGHNGVEVRDTTITGPILPLDARVTGLTDVPIERVTKNRHAFEPLELVERAKEMTRFDASARLIRIDVVHAGANGQVDLDAADYKGSVVYTWELPLPVTETPRPVLRPGLSPPPTPEPMRRIVKSIRVDENGMRVDAGKSDEKRPLEAVSPPRCALPQIWSVARRGKAPEHAVAHVIFDASGAGAWHFEIEGTAFTLDASNDTCEPIAR